MIGRRVFVLVALVHLGACASDGGAPLTATDYLAELQTICRDATAELDALPEPPEQITVADFASSAASVLEDEAEQARGLDEPSDVADDHRAFVRNTDEQASTWRAIAADANAASAELVALTTQVGQLVLGRNDLVAEMGAPDCQRGAR